MCTETSSGDGIQIRAMIEEDYPEVKQFLIDHFYSGEPLCASSGEEAHKCFEDKAYDISAIRQGTCLVAFDTMSGGRMVGVVMASTEYPSDVENRSQQAQTMEQNIYGRVIRMECLAEQAANLYERFGVAKKLYSYVTSVDAAQRGRGIGTRLTTALMELGRAKGFQLLSASCTSFYSARQKAALGMKCAYAIAYADYKNDQGEVIFNPPLPHTHMRIMACRL
ncbi:hypothetical protein KR222_007214 [Zaprionus bogoriensis]|nr:hypothetical protein KR222_007214 [Zaprionus bogoriensis]